VATDATKHPRYVQTTWRVFLSIGMSHITILCAILVYRFFVLCRGIMNNRVKFLPFTCMKFWVGNFMKVVRACADRL
jgi:hypothetical protein